MAMSGQRQAQAALPTGKETRYPLYRTMDRPRGWSGRVRNMSRPPRFDLRTFRTVGSRFTDYDIPVLWSVLSNSRTRSFWLNLPTSQFCWLISSPLIFLLLCSKASLQRCCVAEAHVADMWYPVLSIALVNLMKGIFREPQCFLWRFGWVMMPSNYTWFTSMQISAENSPVRNSETRIAGVFRAVNIAVYGPGVDSASNRNE